MDFNTNIYLYTGTYIEEYKEKKNHIALHLGQETKDIQSIWAFNGLEPGALLLIEFLH